MAALKHFYFSTTKKQMLNNMFFFFVRLFCFSKFLKKICVAYITPFSSHDVCSKRPISITEAQINLFQIKFDVT